MSRCTVILPARNAGQSVGKTVAAVFAAFGKVNVDVLIIDDGSTDNTWDAALDMARANPLISAIRLSRVFGRDSAIFAGLERSGGDCVVVMDADGRHPAEAAFDMYNQWKENGFAIVEGVRISKAPSGKTRKAGSAILRFMFGSHACAPRDDASDFMLLDRGTANLLAKMPERAAFFRGMAFWTGLPAGKVFYEPAERPGKRSGGFLSRAAENIDSAFSFSGAVTRLISLCGAAFFAAGAFSALWAVYKRLTGEAVGSAAVIIFILLITGGAVMVSLGVLGRYVAKIYDEVKYRPRYIIAETSGASHTTNRTNPVR